MVSRSDLLQVVHVHGVQERRKEGKKRGRIRCAAGRPSVARAIHAARRLRGSLAARGVCWWFVPRPACAAALIVGVMRCRWPASLVARRMICAGCRCKPSAAAALLVYWWPLYCIRCAAAAADGLKKNIVKWDLFIKKSLTDLSIYDRIRYREGEERPRIGRGGSPVKYAEGLQNGFSSF